MINFAELNNVIDYIYKGELQIYQEDLDRFLKIAQRLQLEGLLSTKEHEQRERWKNQNYLELNLNSQIA